MTHKGSLIREDELNEGHVSTNRSIPLPSELDKSP